MPTYTIYADDDMADVRSTSSAYATAREGTGSKAWDDTSLTVLAGQSRDLVNRTCAQTFMHFDTSVVEPGAPDGGVELSVFLSRRQHAEGKILEVGAKDWDAADTTGNFVAGSALSASPEYGTITMGASSTYTQFDLAGPADVARVSDYGVMLWGQDQRNNVDITVGTNYWDARIATTRAPNTALWPFLTFTFPFKGSASITLGDITLTSTAAVDCEASAAITLGQIGLAFEGVNGSRGQADITLADITSGATATATVPIVQVPDRTIVLIGGLVADRTLTLED